MPIYRGEGGSGDAVADSASEALLIRALVADADADATAAAASASSAASSASAASSSASSASSSASAAATSATNAANSVASINLANITITGGSITGITDIAVADGGTGASTASDARTNLGLGTIATQAANSVAITGGSINGTTVGASTASTGAFTTLAASSTVSGTGFSTYLASPPAIGGTAAAAGNFTTLGASGVATFSAGTVSAPAITTTGDTNTGIFFPAADSIAFTKGGVQAMRITASSTAEFTRAAGTVPASYDAGELISGLNTDSAYTADSRVISLGASPATATNGTGQEASSGYIRSIGNLSLVTGSTERVRVGLDGNVSFGTPYTAAGAQTCLQIQANDNYIIYSNANTTGNLIRQYFFNPNGTVGTISTSGSNTTYATSSDYRLKENIAPMTGALDTVSQLKPCTYTWKADGEAGQGFIAHELQAVVPDAVSGSKDNTEDIGNTIDADGNIVSNNVTKPTNLQEGWSWEKTGTKPVYQGVDTSFLVATLTAAIQELKAEVDTLKAQINAA